MCPSDNNFPEDQVSDEDESGDTPQAIKDLEKQVGLVKQVDSKKGSKKGLEDQVLEGVDTVEEIPEDQESSYGL